MMKPQRNEALTHRFFKHADSLSILEATILRLMDHTRAILAAHEAKPFLKPRRRAAITGQLAALELRLASVRSLRQEIPATPLILGDNAAWPTHRPRLASFRANPAYPAPAKKKPAKKAAPARKSTKGAR